MSEAVIPSLHFQGRAQGSFRPPAQPFSVSRKVILSAARVRIVGASEGQTHSTSLFVSILNGRSVNAISTDVPEKTPTIAGVSSRFSSLLPGYTYQLEVFSTNFNPTGEDVSITVDLLELDSTIADVTRNVLKEAESKLGVNAITFGISEASFTHFMTRPFTAPELEVGTTSYLKLTLSLETQTYPSWPFVQIDVDVKEFVISGALLLTFSRVNEPSSSPVAVVSTTLRVYCQPAMVTTTKDTLQIQFRRAEVVEDLAVVNITDETGILGGFASIPEFREQVNQYLNQIVSNTGALGFVLPAYLASRSMPDHWHHVLNMELDFQQFDYRSITVHEASVSYLFLVFSMRSLNLPPPCYCETELISLREAPKIVYPNLTESQALPQRHATRDTTSETAQGPLQAEIPRVNYYRIMVPAQIAAFGLSQQSFREIARPYASMGHDESASTGGSIYASARFWFRTDLQAANITDDGIETVVDVTAEGSAKAAVRDRCGHDVLSAGARLRIRIEDTSIQWALRINEKRDSPPELTIEADPVARIGEFDVSFDGVLDPPPPLNQVDDWVLTTVANKLRPALNKLASEKAKIRLIRTVENNGGIRLSFVDDRFFRGEAAVVLGHLNDNSWL